MICNSLAFNTLQIHISKLLIQRVLRVLCPYRFRQSKVGVIVLSFKLLNVIRLWENVDSLRSEDTRMQEGTIF